MGQSRNSPRKVRAARRQGEALRLRAEGLTYPQIAERMGFQSKNNARRLVEEGMDRVRGENADVARTLKEKAKARLEALIRLYHDQALSGDAKAAEVYLRAEAQLAKLEGLDAPSKSQVQVSNPLENMSEAELREEARRHGITVGE